MPVIFSEEILQLVIGFTILTVMILVAVYVLGFLHPRSLQQERSVSEQLDYFQELKSQGKLSPEEFRKIKKRLSAELVEEWENRNKTTLGSVEITTKAAVLMARKIEAGWRDSGNSEDTQIAGGGEKGNSDDTVVGR